MKKRVKILRTPGGKKTVGDQMGYGLYRAQGVRDFESFDKEAPEENIKTTYPKSPREEANIEVEKGEKIIARDGLSVQDVGGKKHSKGGTPVQAEPGSYVVSDFINAPKEMQKAMGFDNIDSNKKKDNTWARVLESKVKSKDYNRLSQILQDAQSGKDVDPYELKTAQIKFPNYQDYVSKAALGGELTKAMMGKPYDIPQIAMPALQKLMGGQQQQGGGGGNQLPEQPQMGFGGYVPSLHKYQTDGTVKPKPKSTVFHTPTGDIEAPIYPQVPPGYTPYPEINNLWQLPGQPGTTGNAPSVNQAIGGGKPNSQWEKWLISQLQKGVTIEELASKKHGTIQGLQKYKQYYKPIAGTEATETKYATTYEPSTGGGGGGEKPGEGDKFACIDGYVQQVNPATANQPGVTYYNSQSEAEAVCGKGKGEEGDDGKGMNLSRIPYMEDINNLANAVHTRYAYHNVPPWQAKATPAYINPVLGSTEGVDRLIQSQGRTAMEDASLYGGSPQAQAARQAQINSSALPSMIQNRVGTNLQNIQSQYAADQYNNQIYNQSAMQDAAAATDLSDKNAKYTYNVDKSKVMGDTNIVRNLNAMLTNSGNTYLMNQRYPQMAFNPMSYKTYFKSGTGKGIYGPGGDSGYDNGSFPTAQYQELKKQALSAGVPADKVDQYVWDMIQRSQPRYRSSYNQMTGYPGTTTTSGYGGYAGGGYPMPPGYYPGMESMEDGGYIPEYNVGGWY